MRSAPARDRPRRRRRRRRRRRTTVAANSIFLPGQGKREAKRGETDSYIHMRLDHLTKQKTGALACQSDLPHPHHATAQLISIPPHIATPPARHGDAIEARCSPSLPNPIPISGPGSVDDISSVEQQKWHESDPTALLIGLKGIRLHGIAWHGMAWHGMAWRRRWQAAQTPQPRLLRDPQHIVDATISGRASSSSSSSSTTTNVTRLSRAYLDLNQLSHHQRHETDHRVDKDETAAPPVTTKQENQGCRGVSIA
ncbi:hypothetical protein BKA80DRAFT_22362 [Phyllosticta citrichinensis]